MSLLLSEHYNKISLLNLMKRRLTLQERLKIRNKKFIAVLVYIRYTN